MNNLRTLCPRVVVVFAIFGLVACASSGPATQYFSLFADKHIETIDTQLKGVAIGIGPIVLPDYLDNPSVVSTTASSRVRIAGYHAWAGDLKESITRVLADDVSRALNLERVWGFPWDTRVRPEYQIRIMVFQFDGVRGGEMALRAKWMLLNQSADKILAVGNEEFNFQTNSESYSDYVKGLNGLLNQFSFALAKTISGTLE